MKMNTPTKFLAMLAAFPLVALAQGPLDPPAAPDEAVGVNPPLVGGNPAPTMKTLHQVEPRKPVNSTTTPGDGSSVFIISQPGSYYLTDNIIATGAVGITITETDVTLDLNGFIIAGNGTAGIQIGNDADRCTVRNGKLLQVNAGSGISRIVSGGDEAEGGTFRDLTVTGHSQFGLIGGRGWTVENCSVQGGSGVGIAAGNGSVVNRCTVRGMKAAAGTWGIQTGGGSVISNCSVTDCDVVAGIRSGIGSTVETCNASGNTNSSSAEGFSAGIWAEDRSTVRGCNATLNGSNKSDEFFGGGISADFACLVVDCEVSNNDGAGIVVAQASVVRGCKSHNNGRGGAGAGILVYDNGGDGINELIENSCTQNKVGFEIRTASNLIVKNTSSGNVGGNNYVAVAGNRVGTVVVPTNSGALSGTGVTASGVGTTDPWANFSF